MRNTFLSSRWAISPKWRISETIFYTSWDVPQANRLRFTLEGAQALRLSSGAALAATRRCALASRWGSLRYTAGMLSTEVQVRALLAHESEGCEEMGRQRIDSKVAWTSGGAAWRQYTPRDIESSREDWISSR